LLPYGLVALVLLAVVPQPARAEAPVRVYAASSLAEALDDVAAAWRRAGHPAPLLVTAGSATLARQVAAGAPADVYLSADPAWMDYLGAHGRVARGSPVALLGNALVLIAPHGAGWRVDLRRGVPLAAAFRGKLCTGEPGVVPVGSYAREALQALGAWDDLESRIVGTEDARAALAFVERGHCGAGIVYATDARGTSRVEVVGTFPPGTHRRIVYDAALLRGARPAGRAFLAFLRDSREAAQAFERRGFVLLRETG
jgi:molybdate transport system substrate-binding protein